MTKLTTMTDEQLRRAKSEATIALILAAGDPEQLLALVDLIEQHQAKQLDSRRDAEEGLLEMDPSKG